MVGDEAFFDAMKNYLNDPKLKHGFARTSDFKNHIEATSGKDLTGFFDDWFYGQGFPIYTIEAGQLPENQTSITIYQSQSHPSVLFFEMPVPVKFYGEGKDTLLVFDNTFSGQMFVANLDFAIDSIKLDPDLWLISTLDTITLGKPDLPRGKNLTLLPNPANDFLIVNHNLGEINSLKIIAMDGKPANFKYEKQGKETIKINLNLLKPGMYILHLAYKDGIVARKFVVKR